MLKAFFSSSSIYYTEGDKMEFRLTPKEVQMHSKSLTPANSLLYQNEIKKLTEFIGPFMDTFLHTA